MSHREVISKPFFSPFAALFAITPPLMGLGSRLIHQNLAPDPGYHIPLTRCLYHVPSRSYIKTLFQPFLPFAALFAITPPLTRLGSRLIYQSLAPDPGYHIPLTRCLYHVPSRSYVKTLFQPFLPFAALFAITPPLIRLGSRLIHQNLAPDPSYHILLTHCLYHVPSRSYIKKGSPFCHNSAANRTRKSVDIPKSCPWSWLPYPVDPMSLSCPIEKLYQKGLRIPFFDLSPFWVEDFGKKG